MRSLVLSLVLVAACGGPPHVGSPCTAESGCDDELTCDTAVPGGYCTAACTMPGTTEECPDESVCDAVAGDDMSCVKICTTKDDCRDDQDCNGVTGSSIKACKPKP